MSARASILFACVLCLSANAVAGESPKAEKSKSGKAKKSLLPTRLDPKKAPPKSQLVAQKKWLKKVLTYGIKSRKTRKEIVKKIDRLSDGQVDILVGKVKKRIYQLEREQLEIARRNLARARQYRNQLYRQRNGVGFRPVITNLFSGTALSAGAVVSPDRRHVRLSLNPFFSELGPVDTFNFRTGEVRRIYTPPKQRRRKPTRTYYDGFRTRLGKPQTSNSGSSSSSRRRAVFRSRVKR